ncbi:MAG: hypothetical protein AB7F75_06605 [Planctomycetota bacterium]
MAKIDPRQNLWQMAHNDRGEMELTTNPDATTVNPEYSVAGYMNEKTDEKGSRILSDTQREPGNLTGLDVPVVCTVNALGQPLTSTVPDGGRGARVITNTYHGNDLLATVRDTAVSAVTDMVQVDWSGEAPYQWVTGVSQPVTERIENFDGATMLPNQRTLTKNGLTFMDFNQAWNADGATPLAYIHNTNSNLSGVFTQPADIRNEFQGLGWLGAGNYAAIARDKNTNLISDNAVAQVFNTRNGITSRAADPWVRDSANFVKEINEATVRKTFITDALGHVVGFERYVSNVLQEAWLDRFDALGRRISKAQTVGGSGYTAFVYFGEAMMETRTPWSATLDRFGTVLGERRYTETATGVTRHHVGPDGNTAYSTSESAGAILAGSNFPADPGLIQRVPGRDVVFDGTSGVFVLASASMNNNLAANQGGLLGVNRFWDIGRNASTDLSGTVDANGERIVSAQPGAMNVASTQLSVESIGAIVAAVNAEESIRASISNALRALHSTITSGLNGILGDLESDGCNVVGKKEYIETEVVITSLKPKTSDQLSALSSITLLTELKGITKNKTEVLRAAVKAAISILPDDSITGVYVSNIDIAHGRFSGFRTWARVRYKECISTKWLFFFEDTKWVVKETDWIAIVPKENSSDYVGDGVTGFSNAIKATPNVKRVAKALWKAGKLK